VLGIAEIRRLPPRPRRRGSTRIEGASLTQQALGRRHTPLHRKGEALPDTPCARVVILRTRLLVVVGQRYSGANAYCLGAQAAGGTTSTQMSTSDTNGAGLSVAGLSLNTSTNWTGDVDITGSPLVKWDKCYNSPNGAVSATDSEVHAA